MPLNDPTIRNAKPREKPFKLGDERGLFLLVKPFGITGTKLIKHVEKRCREIRAEEKQVRKGQRRSRPQDPGSIYWPEITDKGVKGRSQENIEAFLEYAGVSLSFNEMAWCTIVTRSGRSETLMDDVAAALWLEADRLGLPSAENYFRAVIKNLARANSFHPIRDYLDSLEWDGIPRLDEWLHAYLGAENTQLNSAYGRKHLIAAVRRVRQPGCKHDSMIVLQGKQGKGKSSALQALCPSEDFFSDSLSIGMDQKQLMELTKGKWVVEIAELEGMGKREASTVKAMLSRQRDSARMAYGHEGTEAPRQFIIFGTVNDRHFLRDPTGNRRFWAVRMSGRLDPDNVIIASITRDRDQLWAEAAHSEAAGESLMLPRELWEIAAANQAQYLIADPWQEMIEELVAGRDFVLSDTIYLTLGVDKERRNTGVSKRIADILDAMGFERKQGRVGERADDRRAWGYARMQGDEA